MTTTRQRRSKGQPAGSTVTDYRADLWRMADALRGSMDAADYKHVVLGLIFLKYISDAFEELHSELEKERDQGADPEDRDEYLAQNIFWVPTEARWPSIQAHARQSDIGQTVDAAMAALERDNPALRDMLSKNYARESLDKQRLGQVIDLVGNINVGGAAGPRPPMCWAGFTSTSWGSSPSRRAGRAASSTPHAPWSICWSRCWSLTKGGSMTPCCGSSGMFVQSVEFIRAHATGNGNGGKATSDISIYGQESNYTTLQLARMNLAIRGIEGQIAWGDSFHNDLHPDLRADYILANPPFNVSDWGGDRLRDDNRWEHGVPPWATPTSPGSSTSYTTCLHEVSRASCSPMAPCHPASRERERSGRTSSRRTWWTASSHSQGSYSGPPRYRHAYGSYAGADGSGRARPCSSTPNSWASWLTAPTGTCRKKTPPASPRPITHGGETTMPATTPTFPDSARAPRWSRSVTTATSSPREGTSGQHPKRMTGNPSRRR